MYKDLHSIETKSIMKIFDMDELHDENFVILCNEKDDIRTAYIWKGQNFEAEV